jgi:hypothetical protein
MYYIVEKLPVIYLIFPQEKLPTNEIWPKLIEIDLTDAHSGPKYQHKLSPQ